MLNSEKIKKIVSGTVLRDEPMSRHTSFRTGGPADYFIVPADRSELSALIIYLNESGEDYHIVANGTNLLVSDEGIRGAVISLGCHDGTRFTMLGYEETEDGISMEVGAGCLMSAVGRIAARIGASGFEQLSGIPGCIGGACIMNAGAYGREISEILTSVGAIDREGNRLRIKAGDIAFRYRGSGLMDQGLIVTEAGILLKKGQPEEIESGNRAYMKKRLESQPLEYPSAGSVFKRPEGHYAGKLISDAGLKGYSIGGACVSEKHAGFIINRGGASSSDIYALMMYIRKQVFESSGIWLVPEIRFMGSFG